MAKNVKSFEKKKYTPKFQVNWTRTNWILFFVGVVVLALGFYLLSFSPFDNPISLTVSPIVLLIAYLIIFPLSILLNFNKKKNNDIS